MKRKQKENVNDTRQLALWDMVVNTPDLEMSTKEPITSVTNNLNIIPKLIDKKDKKTNNITLKQNADLPKAQKPKLSKENKKEANTDLRGSNKPALTRRQHSLYEYLQQREKKGDRPPTLTEACKDLGLISRGSLHKQVAGLIEAGLVVAMNGKQRGIRLRQMAANDSVLLMGSIAAGMPIEAFTRQDQIPLPSWLRGSADCYALRVHGDSMRDAGILDGDTIVIEPRTQVRNGEMVVALIDSTEVTLKRIEQLPGLVRLHPENQAYTPQQYTPDRVTIQGVVVAALRRY
jgi:repressor LexA